jgi:hypothetical protein
MRGRQQKVRKFKAKLLSFMDLKPLLNHGDITKAS